MAEGNRHRLPRMNHMVNIRKADSELYVEILPDDVNANLVLLLDFQRIPTHKQFKFGTMVKELKDDEESGKFKVWRLQDKEVQNRTGSW